MGIKQEAPIRMRRLHEWAKPDGTLGRRWTRALIPFDLEAVELRRLMAKGWEFDDEVDPS